MNVGLMLQKSKRNLKNNPNEIYNTLKWVSVPELTTRLVAEAPER